MQAKKINLNYSIICTNLEELHDGLAAVMESVADKQDAVSEVIEKQRRKKQFHDYLRGHFKF